MPRYFLLALSFFLVLMSCKPTPSKNESEHEAFDFHPSEWEYLQRMYPNWQADDDVYIEALKQRAKLQDQALAKREGLSAVSWEFVGPTNIGGRIVDIEYDPLRPDTVYAAAATGGIFKSIDKGTTWQAIFDNQAVLTVGDIGIDPKNSDILYAGTGEANGGHNNFAGGGVYRSADAGRSWQFKGLTQSSSIGRVVVDYQNPKRVFVAAVGSYFHPNAERGLFRSDDSGDSWKKVLFVSDSTGCVDVVQHPTNPKLLYAAMWERVRQINNTHLSGKTSAIYKTTDGGDTWQKLTNGLPSGDNGRIGLAISKSQPNMLYALYNDGSLYSGLFRSTDDGASWQNADPARALGNASGAFSDFSWYFGQVRVHPTNPQMVCVLDLGLTCTQNGGTSWTVAPSYNTFHVDQHALAFHPKDAQTMIVGNDGGMNITNDTGKNWRKVAALPVSQFYEIAFDPSNPNRFYGGLQDNGTVRTLTGAANDWTQILGGDGFYPLIDPNNPNMIYAEFQNGGFQKSIDGGNRWTSATSGISSSEKFNWSTPVAMSPTNSQVLYLGTTRLYRSSNGAQSWQAISPTMTISPPSSRVGSISTINVAPNNSKVLYVGTDDGQVWVTQDEGTTWKNMSAGLPLRWVTRIAIDAKQPNVAYAGFSGLKWYDPQPHIFKTTDFGATWKSISSNLPDAPINALAVDPVYPSQIYVGTDVGAFFTQNGGSSWQILGQGLPAVPVYDFKITPNRQYLLAGTHGRSMYKLPLSTLVANEPDAVPQRTFMANLYPNPIRNETKVHLQLNANAQVEIDVFDLQGRKVSTLFDGVQSAGANELQYETKNLPNGTYFMRITVANNTTKDVQTLKMVVAR